jgi:hypothetical protein
MAFYTFVKMKTYTICFSMDQLQLWGPLLGVIIFLALFIWWCRSDDSCCDVERPLLYRCGCKKHKPRDVEEIE